MPLSSFFLISIRANDVDLNLNGHTLDRGWNFRGAGKHGIQISTPRRIGDSGAKNVTIRNGTLRGFVAGVAGILDCQETDCDSATFVYDPKSDTYYFAPDNIKIQNIKFDDVLDKIYYSNGQGRTVIVPGDRAR